MKHSKEEREDRDSIRKDREVFDETGRKIGETNPDPITGEPGSHPIGTGIGAASVGAVGAAIGAVAGPIGALAGAAIGSVVGGLAGHGIAEAIDPTADEAFWREEFRKRPYYKEGHTYEDYAPAYRLGTETRVRQWRNPIRSFENIEGEVGSTWDDVRGDSRLAWEDARHAVRDAWHRTGDRLTSASAPPPADTETTRAAEAAGAEGRMSVPEEKPFEAERFRQNLASRPYWRPEDRWEDFEPAFRLGHEARQRFPGRPWDEVETELSREWEWNRGASRLDWERARLAARDAWAARPGRVTGDRGV